MASAKVPHPHTCTPDDPHLYDLTVNTAVLSLDDAVDLIVLALDAKSRRRGLPAEDEVAALEAAGPGRDHLLAQLPGLAAQIDEGNALRRAHERASGTRTGTGAPSRSMLACIASSTATTSRPLFASQSGLVRDSTQSRK